MMLTEKECLNSYALLTLCVGNITETKIFKQLIEEHFELVEKYKRFKELSNLSDRELMIINAFTNIQTDKCDKCVYKLDVLEKAKIHKGSGR